MARFTLSETKAQKIYTILEQYANAPIDTGMRWSFVNYMTEDSGYSKEWRFQGCLGFGGKLRLNNNRNGLPYVDCYSEDETPPRRRIIEKVNRLILEVMEEKDEQTAD